MKKVLVAALAVALAAVMAIPAGAFENEFGGYWRLRAHTQKDLNAKDNGDTDLSMVDSRTQLYYTAKFSDNLKFVNAFEMDAAWGDGTYGEIGSDGDDFEVKHSYIDFNLGNYNFKLGTQGYILNRSFVFDDDASGVTITGTFGGVEVPFYWIKAEEGGEGDDANDADRDIYAIAPVFKTGVATISPSLVYVSQDDDEDGNKIDEQSYNIGVDVDASFGEANVWLTAIYQGGEYEDAGKDIDRSAYLAAIGGDYKVGAVTIRGQVFYASGDDDANDDDAEAFADITGGGSYYWSEIMGLGMFDSSTGTHETDRSEGSPADKISNVTAFNLGASVSPMEKLTVGADIWYAMLNEDDENGEDKLGTEIDLSATYNVMENLDLDIVAAYLFADDATGGGDEDPMEIGAQLSLSF